MKGYEINVSANPEQIKDTGRLQLFQTNDFEYYVGFCFKSIWLYARITRLKRIMLIH